MYFPPFIYRGSPKLHRDQLGKLRSRYLILKYGSLYEAVHSMDSSGIGGVPPMLLGENEATYGIGFSKLHKSFTSVKNNTNQKSGFWVRCKVGRSKVKTSKPSKQTTLRGGDSNLFQGFWLFLRSFLVIFPCQALSASRTSFSVCCRIVIASQSLRQIVASFHAVPAK